MEINKTQLQSALIDVRKAYRLLFLYQRRMMDTIKFISDTLSLNVESGYSLFSGNAPRNGKTLDLNLWAWDWLNMYMYEFYYGTKETPNGKIIFSIIMQNDTGAWDFPNLTSTEISEFSTVESSSSKMVFVLGKNRWKPDNFEEDVFFSASYKNDFIVNDSVDQFFIARKYNTEDFVDEKSILSILRDFINFTEQSGVKNYFPHLVIN